MSTPVHLNVLHARTSIQGAIRKVIELLPEGRPIPGEVWDRRHAGIVKLVWLHAAGLLAASQSANGKRVRPRTSGLQMFSGNVPVSIEAMTRAPIR